VLKRTDSSKWLQNQKGSNKPISQTRIKEKDRFSVCKGALKLIPLGRKKGHWTSKTKAKTVLRRWQINGWTAMRPKQKEKESQARIKNAGKD